MNKINNMLNLYSNCCNAKIDFVVTQSKKQRIGRVNYFCSACQMSIAHNKLVHKDKLK